MSVNITVQKKISVVIPVFNAKNYLKRCIDSILNQEFTNFEIICIDDGSKDNSLELLNEYANRDKRITVISQYNQGQGIARNKGIFKASGEYLIFVDPDDYIESSYFKTIISYFDKFDDEVLVFNHFYEEEDSKRLFQKPPFKARLKHEQEFKLTKYLDQRKFTLNFAVWDKAYKRDFIIKNNIEFGIGKHGEDQIFTIKSLLLAKKVRYIDKAFYHYVQRKNTSSRQSTKDNIDYVIANYKIVKNWMKSKGLENSVFFKDYAFKCLSELYVISKAIYKPKVRKLLKLELLKKDYHAFIQHKILKQSIIKEIFSLENYNRRNSKVKILKLFGFKFILKRTNT